MYTNSQIIENIDALRFKEEINKLEGLVIDVRTPEEFHSGYIQEATNIDFYANDFEHKLKMISKDIPVYVYCRSGGRSYATAKKMEMLGFTKVYNLVGGIVSWDSAGYKIKNFTDDDGVYKEGRGAIEPIFTALEIDSFLTHNEIVLLAFITKWCVPCKKIRPILEDIQIEKSNIKVVFIDADVNKELLSTYNVNGLPTLIFFSDKKLVYSHVGMISKQELEKEIDYL
jgi:rhodanese-related sulfurtransferase